MPTSGSFRVSQSAFDGASTPCSVWSLTCSPDHRTCLGAPVDQVGIACIVAVSLPRLIPGCHFGARRDGTVGVTDDFVPAWCLVQIGHGVCLATGRCDTNTGFRAEGNLGHGCIGPQTTPSDGNHGNTTEEAGVREPWSQVCSGAAHIMSILKRGTIFLPTPPLSQLVAQRRAGCSVLEEMAKVKDVRVCRFPFGCGELADDLGLEWQRSVNNLEAGGREAQ